MRVPSTNSTELAIHVPTARVRLQILQHAVAHSLFLVTVAAGVVAAGAGAAVANSPEGTRAYSVEKQFPLQSNQTLTVDSDARFEGLQAQFPSRRDRIENNRDDRWENNYPNEVRRCLDKRDRDDREECLEDLKRDQQRDRDRRYGKDNVRYCLEKRDEDDRRRCLRNARNRRRNSERDRLERRDDLYDRLERNRRFPF